MQPELLLTDAGLSPTHSVSLIDALGVARETHIAGERPLTLYVDKREIVTLMTLGTHPEALVLGYLRNQGFLQSLSEVKAVQVDWDIDAAVVVTRGGIDGLEERLQRRTVTSGCGQGTVFGNWLEELIAVELPALRLRQSRLYGLLETLARENDVYKRAGAVHGCALCHDTESLIFVEDVGRHNAADAIAGMMWLRGIAGGDKIFYTTGRLTSEMVMKVAQMGISVLLSRSGITHMGLSMARRLGVTLIARAQGRDFQVFHGAERIVFDAIPADDGQDRKRSRRLCHRCPYGS